jgi:hypothetical protein
MTEYFFDGTNDVTIFPPAVSIEPVEVDFGACPGPKPSNPVPLCLMNHTKGKITVVWKRRSDCPFWVTPDTCDVPPLKSMAMRLHFQPSCPNSLYAVELEAFAVYKVCACRPVEVGRHVLCWTLKGGVELQGVTEGTAGPGFSYIFLGWMVPLPTPCYWFYPLRLLTLCGSSDMSHSCVASLPPFHEGTQLGQSPLEKFGTPQVTL